MVEFNPYLVWYVSASIGRLSSVNIGMTYDDFLPVCITAQGALHDFIEHEQHNVFPETKARAEHWIKLLDHATEPRANAHSVTIQAGEVLQLRTHLREFEVTFENECRRIYVVALEKQRALDTHTLVESIEAAFSAGMWCRFSKMTKREAEESGKCIAFERYTASGFHILRAVESEIRDYIYLLTHAKPLKRDWGEYIKTLQNNGANPKLVSTLESIRSLDRNPLMHPEDWLEQDDAIALFNAGVTAMNRIISDMERQGLLPPL